LLWLWAEQLNQGLRARGVDLSLDTAAAFVGVGANFDACYQLGWA
jgi:hypothetical protein